MDITYSDLIIIYEDNHLLVVVKPQGIPCCPDNSSQPNLLDLLKQYLIEKYNKPGDAYLGLVHRLDQPTGGVMVYAKSSKAARRLSDNLKNRSVAKRYFAITSSVPKSKKGILKNALYKDNNKNMVYCVPIATTGAKMAELEYKVLEEFNGMALVDINLITGRAHQARAQMAHIGSPVYGDKKYGGKSSKGEGIALWAVELRFPHPVTKDIMVFRVHPPTDELPWKNFDIESKLAVIK